MLMIEVEPLSNGAHRNQSGPELPAPEGWAVVPPELEAEALACLPFIRLKMQNGYIVGVAQGEDLRPGGEAPSPEPEPSADEILNTLLGL